MLEYTRVNNISINYIINIFQVGKIIVFILWQHVATKYINFVHLTQKRIEIDIELRISK